MAVADLELETPRLRLRTPLARDAQALQGIVADPRVALATASIPHPYPESGAAAFIDRVRGIAATDRRNLAIVRPGNDELIGLIGFGPAGRDAEVSYLMSPRWWGHGFASEAADRVIAHIFEANRVSSIIARTMTTNLASAGVLRKVGFRRDGEAAVALPTRGGVFPTTLWRLDPATWRSPARAT